MKSFSSTLFAFLLFSILHAQNPVFDWVVTSEGEGIAETIAITTDSLGNIYAAGDFYGTRDFDPGPGVTSFTSTNFTPTDKNKDIFVQKFDNDGNFIWAFSIGSDESDKVWGLSLDAYGDLYISGQFFGESIDLDPGPDSSIVSKLGATNSRKPFLLKVDGDGNFIWGNMPVNGSGFFVGFYQAITTDDTGNVYLTGTYNDRVDFDPDTSEYMLTETNLGELYIQKLDREGKFQWVKSMPGNITATGNDIEIDSEGNILLVGLFQGTVDMDPGPDSLKLTTERIAINFFDGFMLKLNPLGELIWAYSMGWDNIPTDICTDTLDNIYLTGSYAGSADFDLGPGTEMRNATASSDAFVVKYTADATFEWAISIGGDPNGQTGSDALNRGNDIAVDKAGNVYFTGLFQYTIDLDPGPGIFLRQAVNQNPNIFIEKLTPNGEFIWAQAIGFFSSDYANSIALDHNDDVITGGISRGDVDFDAGNGVSTLNPAGGTNSSNFILKNTEEWTVGIENIAEINKLHIFPNPVRNELNFEEVTLPFERIDIFDLAGKRVLSTPFKTTGIEVSHLPSGIYMLKVYSQGSWTSQKFLKY